MKTISSLRSKIILMHYLKCPDCSHFNELKTEYLTFFKKCNKVLRNSYTNWKKENPERSFEDFKLQVCTTDPVEQPKEKTGTGKTRGLKYRIGFTLAFAMFYALGQLGGDKLVSLIRKPAFDKNLMAVANELNSVD